MTVILYLYFFNSVIRATLVSKYSFGDSVYISEGHPIDLFFEWKFAFKLQTDIVWSHPVRSMNRQIREQRHGKINSWCGKTDFYHNTVYGLTTVESSRVSHFCLLCNPYRGCSWLYYCIHCSSLTSMKHLHRDQALYQLTVCSVVAMNHRCARSWVSLHSTPQIEYVVEI